MAGIAGAAAALIDELEADRTVWAEQTREIAAIVARGQEAQDVEWSAASSRAFREALAGWVRDGYDLMLLAEDVLLALGAHIDALRDVADALAAAAVAGDGAVPTLPGLANPVPFGGLL